jgi:hypothetical protein
MIAEEPGRDDANERGPPSEAALFIFDRRRI